MKPPAKPATSPADGKVQPLLVQVIFKRLKQLAEQWQILLSPGDTIRMLNGQEPKKR